MLIFPEHEFILSFVGYSFIFIYRTALIYSYSIVTINACLDLICEM